MVIHILKKIRIEKLDNLKAQGKDPYEITKFDYTIKNAELRKQYEELEARLTAEANGDEIGVLDPMYRPGRFDIPGRKGKVRMEGNVAYADWRVLRDDCRERPFFLFSKKEK